MTAPSQRRLGASGLLVSAAGLGCNNFGRAGSATETLEGTRAVLDAAIDAGITLLDTADMYGKEPGLSETLIGEALGSRRDQVVLATKFGHSGAAMPGLPTGAKGSRAYIRRAVEGSLRRLQTDWIDLYQLHTPDPGTPIEETLDALAELVREGKVRYIGHSNFAGWQIAEAHFVARERHGIPFISAQNHYSLLARAAEREVLPAVERFGVGFLPYFPLHNGLLTGKFRRDEAPEDTRIMRNRRHVYDDAPWDALEAYERFCRERGITMLQATYGWLLSRPELSSVIAGATTPEQVRANAAATDWTPDAAELAAIDELFPLVADPAARV
ncbi:aldo/keto reductase [Microbacterium sp. zg.Y1090]|uniref:aldo/keto reductase n=1 Tax=Microbacterium TaxID=33882 RepID=UPI00214BEC63|nr:MULTISPECIES: aldo/keto reductase [unclassified Microbacterium]MCR2813468.1 aldo/keto reductase [Microbacterium sp. zg.Y1084]MCR2818196.1 aldo/keto reductase [Microbacterium sp. zg.Y1090]MDL5486717.1 aldo/keto reductase [Microbacterium sp. zg-Y1211]WIM27654.1 aldo/keto reductase [Microbacterium sp. zg-Y1090]